MKRKKNETICTVPFGERSGKQRPLPTDCHKKIGTAHPLTSLLTSLQCHVTKEEPISTLKERERKRVKKNHQSRKIKASQDQDQDLDSDLDQDLDPVAL